MLNRTASIIVGIVLILIIGISVYVHKQSKDFSLSVVVENPVATTTIIQSATTTEPVIQPSTSTTPTAKPTPTTPKPTTPAPTPAPKPTPTPTPTPVQAGITLAQVAQHNSRESCWSAINGNVYDLTSWIPNHPGGEQRILRICGRDGSDDYNGQHGGSHRTATILAGFKLDVLAQ